MTITISKLNIKLGKDSSKKTEDKYICGACYDNNLIRERNYTIYTIHPLTSLCQICNKNQTSNYIQLEINPNITPCCGKEMKLKLFPDYCSSGIWCFHCGCSLNGLQLPDGLINLCEVWNNLWDNQISKAAYREDEYFAKIWISTGKYLCELINQYCYCEFECSEEEIIEDIIKERRRF